MYLVWIIMDVLYALLLSAASADCYQTNDVPFSLQYTSKHLEKLSRKAEKDAEKEQAKVQKVSGRGGCSMYEV